jgi:hypothetical protein
MLICKGFAVSFKLASGKTVKAPGGYGLLHDPGGKDWAKCSGLIAPFSKGGSEIDDAKAKDYFGHTARGGELKLPPRSLGEWKKLGVVSEILYTRRRPGRLPADHQDRYYHPISNGTATLYRRGRMLRIELGPGCDWSYRGIVSP